MKASDSSNNDATGPARSRTSVLGLPVDVIETTAVVDEVVRSVAARQRLRIAVLNHNKCWLASRDGSLTDFIREAELVVPETSVVLGARLLGRTRLQATWGVTLLGRLLAEADRRAWSVYLLGATPDVASAAAVVVERRFPGARLVGSHHGYLEPEAVDRVFGELRSVRPDLLFVGMGSPAQELFIAGLPFPDGPVVSMGVGGSLDVLAGRKRDAPSWIRGTGLEWLYRSIQSPRLFGRYLKIHPWYVSAIVRERLTGRVPPRLASRAVTDPLP